MSEQQRITDLLRDLHGYIGSSIPQTISEHYQGCDLLDRIESGEDQLTLELDVKK